MFDIGFLELSLIATVALLVLGPERLPAAARTAGKWIGTAKRMIRDVTNEIDEEIKLAELKEQLEKERAQIDRVKEEFDSRVRQANETLDEVKGYDPFEDDDDKVQLETSQSNKPLPPPRHKVSTPGSENASKGNR